MNHLLNAATGASGIDMDQVIKVGKALLFSPLIGFAFAAVLFLLVKRFLRNKWNCFSRQKETSRLATDPCHPDFTCTGVSFAHGSNDGQRAWA